MLNEIQEFNQYSFDITQKTKKIHPRLNHRQFCNGMSGIERAMTIIARYFFFNYYSDNSESIPSTEKRIELTYKALKAWCGADEEYPKKYKRLQNWLPNYVENILKQRAKGRKTSIQKLDQKLVQLKNKKKEFAKSMFLDYISDLEATKYFNDFKKITYESIVANAINMGELTEKVLLSKSDPFDRIEKEKGNVDDLEKDRIIKIICAFLLNRTNDMQLFAVVNKADIANWCKGDPKMDKDDYAKFVYSFNGKTVSLFETVLIANNIVKFKVAPELLNYCKFVICENEAKTLNSYIEQGYNYIYRDKGSGELLLHTELKKVCD